MSGSTGSRGQAPSVIVAAGTARGSGGRLAVKAVTQWMSQSSIVGTVLLPSGFELGDLPLGPDYRRISRMGAYVRELWGVGGNVVYVGMADRLPVLRRPPVAVMVAQNDLLYGSADVTRLARRHRIRVAVLARWARSSLRRAAWVVAATNATKSGILASGAVDEGRVVVRPIPPQDIDVVKSSHRERIEQIAMIGDVYPFKRFAWAVEEIDEWAVGNGLEPEIVHVGRIFDRTAADELHAAGRACKRASLRLSGAVPHDAAVATLAAADVLVVPSARESYGLPVAEALAVGVPIVCSDLPQFHELAGPTAAYFTSQRGALAAALAGCEERVIREEMARNGRDRVVPNLGWDVLSPPPARPGPTGPA